MRPAQHGAGEQDIATWPLANGEALKLRICHYKDREFIDLRRWYRDADGELRPSPRGIRVNSEMAAPLAELLVRIDAGEFAMATTKTARSPWRRARQEGAT